VNVYIPSETRERMKSYYDLVWSQIATAAFEAAMDAHDRVVASPCVVVCGNRSFGPVANFAAAHEAVEKRQLTTLSWAIIPFNQLKDEEDA
jgi:hypothetical protein